MSRAVNLYADLYSVRQFAGYAVDACESGESVVVLLPSALGEPDAWTVVQSAFNTKKVSVSEVKVDFGKHPAQFFHEHLFGKPAESPEQALDLLVEKPWPQDKRIIYARGLSGRADNATEWYEVVQNLTRRIAESGSLDASTRSVLLFNHLDRNSPRPPRADRPLRVLWWFGVPSVLDFRLFCRQLLDGNQDLDIVTKRWMENIVPVLAGGDFEQVQKICQLVESTTDDLEMYLEQFARQKNWDAETLLNSGAGHFFRTPADLAWVVDPNQPPPNVKLWADGVLYATAEEGVRLHAAAVRLLGQTYASRDIDKRNFRLNHMIWQAQNRLCYGLLNEARLILNETIEDREGAEWTFRSKPRGFEELELRKSNLTCEIAHLGRLLQRGFLPSFGGILGESVAKMNGVRTCLAHYRPLDLMQLKEFVAVMQGLPEILAQCKENAESSLSALGRHAEIAEVSVE